MARTALLVLLPAFSLEQARKLYARSDRGESWAHMTVQETWNRLQEELTELADSLTRLSAGIGTHHEVLQEAADCANFLMFLTAAAGCWAGDPSPYTPARDLPGEV